MGCGAKELGILGYSDAAGAWNYLVAFREASWNFPRRQDRDFEEFRGFPVCFPGMEFLGWPNPQVRAEKLQARLGGIRLKLNKGR